MGTSLELDRDLPESWRRTPSGKRRARGLGLAFAGEPGPDNAITDVAGVAVGYATLISGAGALVTGKGPVRTGVTAILPRAGGEFHVPCAAGSSSFNGNGEMTGLLWVEEAGELTSPITITNTHSCGTARDATIEWLVRHARGTGEDWSLPVAAETYDGELSDINGFHVKPQHVFAALDDARSGPIEMGSVGGGTGMICYDFKGGSGTSSRTVAAGAGRYRLGAFVQANFGLRAELTVLGVPVGRHITGNELRSKPKGSIIAIVATDAPLMPHQLKRLARRVPVGMARTGTIGHNTSGDIFLAFSTANRSAFASRAGVRHYEWLPNSALDPLFESVAQTVEEAIIDSMIANETMTGVDGNTAIALPHDRLLELMERQPGRRGP